MESIKLPGFLNTSEKYNEMVKKTDTVQKYEEVFYQAWPGNRWPG